MGRNITRRQRGRQPALTRADTRTVQARPYLLLLAFGVGTFVGTGFRVGTFVAAGFGVGVLVAAGFGVGVLVAAGFGVGVFVARGVAVAGFGVAVAGFGVAVAGGRVAVAGGTRVAGTGVGGTAVGGTGVAGIGGAGTGVAGTDVAAGGLVGATVGVGCSSLRSVGGALKAGAETERLPPLSSSLLLRRSRDADRCATTTGVGRPLTSEGATTGSIARLLSAAICPSGSADDDTSIPNRPAAGTASPVVTSAAASGVVVATGPLVATGGSEELGAAVCAFGWLPNWLAPVRVDGSRGPTSSTGAGAIIAAGASERPFSGAAGVSRFPAPGGGVRKPATARASRLLGPAGETPNRVFTTDASATPKAAPTLALPPLATTVAADVRARDGTAGAAWAMAVPPAPACGSRETSQRACVQGRSATDGTGTKISRSTMRSTTTSTGTSTRTSRGTTRTSTRGTPASARACKAANSGRSSDRNAKRRTCAKSDVRLLVDRSARAVIGCILARHPKRVR
jgi:hypothetical protein